MNYDDLWDIWLSLHEESTPKGMFPVKQHLGAPKNYFLTPEDMTILIRAMSPYDLYMKPDERPIPLDYPTNAFNISNLPTDLGIPNTIVQASRDPKDAKLGMYGTPTAAWLDIPLNKQRLGYPRFAQGVYEHEVGHYLDPRMFPLKNKGNLIKYGIPQGTAIMTREAPAIEQERRFWRGY